MGKLGMGRYLYQYRKYRHIGTFFSIGSIGIGNKKSIGIIGISAKQISAYRRIGKNVVSAHP